MNPETLTTLSPTLQWGFAGFSFLLLCVLVWLIWEFLSVLKRCLDVIPPLTVAVHELHDEMAELKKSHAKIAERLLTFRCPMGGQSAGG